MFERVIKSGFFCLALAFIGIVFAATPARADCTSPAGVESQTRFDANIMYFCDGTNWQRMDYVSGAAGLGCIVGNVAIPHNASATFYLRPGDSNCSSISAVRTCNNGVLGGDTTYEFPTCGVITTACALDGISTTGSYGFYKSDPVACNEGCEYRIRHCQLDGTFSGDPAYNKTVCQRDWNCSAVTVGTYKWYLGKSGESCDQTCTGGRGGCNLNGILNYTGSNGTNANCQAVLTALSINYTAFTSGAILPNTSGLIGCIIDWQGGGPYEPMLGQRVTPNVTSCAGTYGGKSRVCSCNN